MKRLDRLRGDRDWGATWRRLGRRPFVLSFALLAVVALVRLILHPGLLDVLLAALVAIAGAAAVLERREVAFLEGGRRTEAESFARILRGLARSVSPDAIVSAIVEELGHGTGADHVAVVRRRPEAGQLEVVLVATRPGAPASRTTLPLSALEDPALEAARSGAAVAASRGRRMAAVRIDPDPAGDPGLVPLGLVADRLGTTRSATMTLDPTNAPVAVRRSAHATPLREGAGQRIADGLAARLSDIYGLSHTLAAPLRIDGRVEGAIVVSRRRAGAWPSTAGRILAAAAVEASAALARVYSLREAEARATTDALTGLPNRRYFDEYVALLARRRRADDRMGVLMIDIDRFKQLNDTFGHAVGDHVLRAVAGAIAGALREEDVPVRFGGEEFAVLLKHPSPSVAAEVGERVRCAVKALDLRKLGVPGVTVSVGVAMAVRPDQPLHEVIDAADRALYRAKRAGRDRVMTDDDRDPQPSPALVPPRHRRTARR